jgi:hypothetical protein
MSENPETARPFRIGDRRCRTCGYEGPLEDYSKHASSPFGRANHCKPCTNASTRRWREANPESRRAGTRRWVVANPERVRARIEQRVERNRRIVAKARDERGNRCQDCGKHADEIVRAPDGRYPLDFHHRDPATKLFGVSAGVSSGRSVARLLAEIAKCDLLCASCHKKADLARLAA